MVTYLPTVVAADKPVGEVLYEHVLSDLCMRRVSSDAIDREKVDDSDRTCILSESAEDCTGIRMRLGAALQLDLARAD